MSNKVPCPSLRYAFHWLHPSKRVPLVAYGSSHRLGTLTRQYSSNSSHKAPTHCTGIEGRSCLVTGATSGIGRAVLTRLLADGASHVRIISRDRERAVQVIERACEETGRKTSKVTVIEQDLDKTDFTSIKLFTAEDDWPAINTFIHCAGISQSSLAISTSPISRASIMRINVEVYMHLLADFVKSYHSFASRSKDLTNPSRPSFCAVGVSSLLATKGGYGSSTYAASKAAMLAYNRAVTVEAGQIVRKYLGKAPSLRINTVVPGYINTPMIEAFSTQTRSDLENQIPGGRFGTADEVADAIMFLVSNEYANNCVLNLDGGLSAT